MTERPILFKAEMVRAILGGLKTQTRRVIKIPGHIERRGLHPKTWDWMGNRYTTGSGQYPGGNPRFTGDQPPGLLITCNDGTCQRLPCPYGWAGNHLYVREAWRVTEFGSSLGGVGVGEISYRADGTRARFGMDHDWASKQIGSADWEPASQQPPHARRGSGNWKPSIYMPRWASRLTLEVTNVRVQRLHAITDREVLAEGILQGYFDHAEGPPNLSFEPDRVTIDGLRAQIHFAKLWDGINGKRSGCSWRENPWVWAVDFRAVPELPSTSRDGT